MEDPQKSVPNPINNSLETEPTRMLKRLKTKSGKVNFHEPS